MAKTLNPTFANAIAAGTAKLVRIFEFTLTTAGSALRFTDHDTDLIYGGQTYRASNTVDISAVTTTMAGGAQAADLNVMFGDNTATSFTYTNAVGGLYDFASVLVTVIDAFNTATPGMVLMAGTLGSVSLADVHRGTFKINGPLQGGVNLINEKYSPECRANLGDSRCKVNLGLTPYTTTGTVTVVLSNRKFQALLTENQANDYYAFGMLTFTSGNNNGLTLEPLTHFQISADDEIVMAFAFPKDIQVGDTFTLTAGCDKRPQTCSAKFNNIVNYRGEPFIPPADKLKDRALSNANTDPQGAYIP